MRIAIAGSAFVDESMTEQLERGFMRAMRLLDSRLPAPGPHSFAMLGRYGAEYHLGRLLTGQVDPKIVRPVDIWHLKMVERAAGRTEMYPTYERLLSLFDGSDASVLVFCPRGDVMPERLGLPDGRKTADGIDLEDEYAVSMIRHEPRRIGDEPYMRSALSAATVAGAPCVAIILHRDPAQPAVVQIVEKNSLWFAFHEAVNGPRDVAVAPPSGGWPEPLPGAEKWYEARCVVCGRVAPRKFRWQSDADQAVGQHIRSRHSDDVAYTERWVRMDVDEYSPEYVAEYVDEEEA